MNFTEHEKRQAWLLVLQAFSCLALLALLDWILAKYGQNEWGVAYCRSVIPNLSSSLLVFLVLYAFLYRKGIQSSVENKLEQMVETVHQRLSSADKVLSEKGCIDFYTSFRDVPWRDLLPRAKESIDIVVNYWDSWANNHRDFLRTFFQQRNACLRLFLPDPRKKEVMRTLRVLYPDHTEKELLDRIEDTRNAIIASWRLASGTEDQLKIYYLPICPTYAVQLFDKRTMVLSNYDMCRDRRVGAPAFLLDIARSGDLQEYWLHEIDGLASKGRQILGEHVSS